MVTTKLKKVFIYDPNWINPYGLELAAIIGASGSYVHLWCTENRRHAPPNVRLHSKLIGSRGSRPLGSVIFYRFIAPLIVILTTPRSAPLILVWTRDPWDAFVFGMRAALGGKTILIYHNPFSIRGRPGLSGRMEKFVLSFTTLCVVHSARLAAAAAADVDQKKIYVAAHPPYDFTTRSARSRASENSSELPLVAFVGALRHDKGSDDLVTIAEQTNTEWVLRILGPDRLPSPTETLLHNSGVMCEYIGDGGGPSDKQLIEGLLSADVMIAPYRSVTESGSVHMALSLRVPVLAYESPGLSHVLNDQSMAASPESFGHLLERYLETQWCTYTERATKLHSQCSRDWSAILGNSS